MGMKAKNETRYSGVMLRSVFLAVVNHVEKVLSNTTGTPLSVQARAAFIRARCTVAYVYTRGGGCSGRASLGGGWCRIRIARDEVKLAELAWLIQHEVYHLFGVKHQDMPHAVNHWSASGTAAAADHYADVITRYGEVVREEPKPAKVVVSTDEKRVAKLTSIVERIGRWEAKQRRAEKALQKLQRQRRYYEGQLALAAKGTS